MSVLFDKPKYIIVCFICINHTRSLNIHGNVLFTDTDSGNANVRLPISSYETNSFREIRYNRKFVDKTKFIKEFLEYPDTSLYVMAPSKFGKSLIIDMLNNFLESQAVRQNSSLTVDTTEEYKLFDQTNIKKNRAFFDNHIQGYQIIRLDFQPYAKVTDFESFKNIHCRTICRMMSRHTYLRSTDSNLTWLKYMNDDENCSAYCLGNFDTIGYAGRQLSHELSRTFYWKPVVFLGDNFDAFFRGNIEFDTPDSKKILNKFLNFVSRLVKRNLSVKRSLLVGTLNFAGVHPHLTRNIKYINFNYHPEFAPYFGFTQPEVVSLLQNFSKSQALEKVKNCYNGYTVKRAPQLEIYNPFSVISFLKTGEVKGFWVKEAPSLERFKNLFSNPLIGSEIQDILLENSGLHAFLDDKLTLQQITSLKRYSTTPINRMPRDLVINPFIRYLTQIGYLALQPSGPFEGDYLKVPNLETEQRIEKYLYESDYILNSLKITLADTEKLAEAFLGLSKNETYFLRLAEVVYRVFKNNPPSEYSRPTILGFLYGSLKRSIIRTKFRVVRAKVKLDGKDIGVGALSDEKVDLVIITPDSVGIVLKTKLKDSSYISLKQVIRKRYFDVFEQKFSNFKLTGKIFLGVSLDDSGRCSISYVKDSTDLNRLTQVKYPILT